MTGPGWVYDAASGHCRGPASYELAERYKANHVAPIMVNYNSVPTLVHVRPVQNDPMKLKAKQ